MLCEGDNFSEQSTASIDKSIRGALTDLLESYTGNVVVYCGCIGLLPLKKFRKNAKPGDIMVLAGGKTGRDGIHGVTFASAELTEKSEDVSRPAVQIANPIEEEKRKRAINTIRDLQLASSITEFRRRRLVIRCWRDSEEICLRRHSRT